MELVFLGTASGYPSPHRGASGLVLRDLSHGVSWLFDCGEGTQIQAQRSPRVKLGRLSTIFISHLHGDHMYGLPGLLCTVDQQSSVKEIDVSQSDAPKSVVPDVNIYGPQGLRRFLRLALALSRARLRYTYAVHELILREEHCPVGWTDWACPDADAERDPPLACEILGRNIDAASDGFWYNVTDAVKGQTFVHCTALKHSIPSLGWFIQTPQKLPSLRVDVARSLGVPDGRLMGELKRGIVVTVNGNIISPEQVLYPPMRGYQIAILGDSSDSQSLVRLLTRLCENGQIQQHCLDALVHEATLEDSMLEDALAKGHSTPSSVVQLAADLNVRLLILTHFSQRYMSIGEDTQTTCSESGENIDVRRGKPSVQRLLDDALKIPFSGEIQLAEDLALFRIPPVDDPKSLSFANDRAPAAASE